MKPWSASGRCWQGSPRIEETVRRLVATDESFDALCHQYRHVIDLLERCKAKVDHDPEVEQFEQRRARLEERLLTRIEGYQPQ
jgi:hypothetical protein